MQTSTGEGGNEGPAQEKGAKLEAGPAGPRNGRRVEKVVPGNRMLAGAVRKGEEREERRGMLEGSYNLRRFRAEQGYSVSWTAHGARPCVGGGDSNGTDAVRGGPGVAVEVLQTHTSGNGHESRDLRYNSIGGTLAAELEGKDKGECPVAQREAVTQEAHDRRPLEVSDIWAFKSRMTVFPSGR